MDWDLLRDTLPNENATKLANGGKIEIDTFVNSLHAL